MMNMLILCCCLLIQDKSQRIPEMRAGGYGIRAEKLKNKPVKHTNPVPDKGKPPKQEIEANNKKYKPV